MHGIDDRHRRVAEDRRPPGADVVDVAFAIDVFDAAALGATDEKRFATDIAEGAHGRINAAGNKFFGGLEKLVGNGIAHVRGVIIRSFPHRCNRDYKND